MKAFAAEMAATSQGAILKGARKRKEREEEEKDGDGEEESEGSQGGEKEKGDGESEGSGNGEGSKKKGKGKGKTPGAARACKGRAEMAQFAAVNEALLGFGEKEARRMNKWQKRREAREEEWRREQRELWEQMHRHEEQLLLLLARLIDKIPDKDDHVGKEHEE